MIALLLALALAAHAGPAPVEKTLAVGGQTRRYLLVAPERASDARRPLVVVLHGHGGSARQALGLNRRGRMALARWTELAAREGVLVAAPDGLEGPDGKQGWNDCRRDAVNNPSADDVAFLDALVGRLIAEEGADPRRVYLMGMSNGAMMTFRAALEMREAPAAAAAVCGSMAADSACGPARRKVSLLLIAGTKDPLVPYGGGAVGMLHRDDRGKVVSVAETAAFWRAADGLSGEPRREDLPHRDPGDPTSARRETWGEAKGPQVTLITIEGGGHVEPSPTLRAGPLYRLVAGAQNGDLEAADEAWSFFKDKRRL